MNILRTVQKIRYAVFGAVLAPEMRKTQKERDTYLALQKRLREDIERFEEHKKNITVRDIMRERLAGLNPRLLDKVSEDDSELLDYMLKEAGDSDEVFEGRKKEFLARMHDLAKNDELVLLIDWLVRNQTLITAREAQTQEAINFGRATLNGLELVKEEIERYAGLYKESHAGEEPFDEHTAV